MKLRYGWIYLGIILIIVALAVGIHKVDNKTTVEYEDLLGESVYYLDNDTTVKYLMEQIPYNVDTGNYLEVVGNDDIVGKLYFKHKNTIKYGVLLYKDSDTYFAFDPKEPGGRYGKIQDVNYKNIVEKIA